jgi:hypothetical protein
VGKLEALLNQKATLSFGVTKEEEIISVGDTFWDKAFMKVSGSSWSFRVTLVLLSTDRDRSRSNSNDTSSSAVKICS